MLTKPLAQQFEQLSNARALEELEYASVIYGLSEQAVLAWLGNVRSVRIDFPEVHSCLAQWLVKGKPASIEELASVLWDGVTVQSSINDAIL